MKTTADVLRHLEERMTWMVERPEMYAANPESLEDQLSLLDDLRKQLIAPEADSFALHDAGYTAFLRSNDYGVANFCHRYRDKRGATTSDGDLFRELAGFWRRYMQSPHYAGPWPIATKP